MTKMVLQRILLVLGVVGLIVVLVDLGISIAATFPRAMPAHVDHATAGPYSLTINLYTYPANAGYALPFAVSSTQAVNKLLTYKVYSIPGKGVDATPIRATFHTVPSVQNGIQGAAEITVRGSWMLQVTVNGFAGQAVVNVPVTAVALPPIPVWLGWAIGFVPFYVFCVFLVMQLTRDKKLEHMGNECFPVQAIQVDTSTS